MDKRLKAGADLLTGESYKPLKYEAPEETTAAEIDRQATEGQRELQRLADEAAEAMRGKL